MRIRVLRSRVFMDAGIERRLDTDRVYELPDVVARALIATGAAAAAEESAIAAAPETKPMMPIETKARARGQA